MDPNFRLSSEPLVSVIIPTYNRFDSVLKCIQKTREQTHKNIEIIVIDDCSSDSYDKQRLRDVMFLKTPCRGGPAAARNVGLKACSGDYICFLDDDDAWHSDKLKRQLQDLLSNNFHFSATEGYWILDQTRLDSNPLYHRQFYKEFMIRDIKMTTLPRFMDQKFLSHHNYIITSSVMISRGAYETTGLWHEDRKYI